VTEEEEKKRGRGFGQVGEKRRETECLKEKGGERERERVCEEKAIFSQQTGF